MENKIGVLLTNIGTPDSPTPSATRRYLKQFLSDRRVVEIPRALWLPILYGFILPCRSTKSARLYQKIWTEEGSPLLMHSRQLRKALADTLNIPVALGMHYGHPSIPHALEELKKKNIQKIIVLPLYPQYSATTTAATFDAVSAVLKNWRVIPDIQMITDYADHPLYIKALADSIQTAYDQHPSKKLIFSFHSIPKKYVASGDPYQSRCEKTVSLLAERLNLTEKDYALTYQSRLGRAKWLQPYTDKTFHALPKKGITDISVMCPGFAVDCLETLEEIAIRGKEQFFKAGGKNFRYIPALNDCKRHVELLVDLIRNN
ncbi:MAG TPA: ferrochelatase [Gammaproteobacteria bacterium]|nr:ferrochelatase [Gammaproteobacteria bacterium]